MREESIGASPHGRHGVLVVVRWLALAAVSISSLPVAARARPPVPPAPPPSVAARARVCPPVADALKLDMTFGPIVVEPLASGPRTEERPAHPACPQHGYPPVRRMPDARAVRARLEANLGAYRACYLEARTRRPDLAGQIAFDVVFDTDGWASVTTPSAKTAHDPALATCLRAALREVWIDASHTIVVGHVPLDLQPARK